jgi:hypothetical protein
VDEIGSAVVADPTAMQCESGIAQLGSGHSGQADINRFRLHVQTVQGDTSVRAARPQELVGARGSISADDIDLNRGTTEGSGQVVQRVKHARIVVVHITGAIIAQVLVEAVECLRQIRVATRYTISSRSLVGVVEPQRYSVTGGGLSFAPDAEITALSASVKPTFFINDLDS